MVIRKQDFSVLLFYYLGYSRLINFVHRMQNKPLTRFLVFHDVLPENIKTFEANLSFLKYKTNSICLNDFFIGKLSTKKINTVITFDDGYKSWITNVLPILKKFKLPATFFISSGFVGLSKNDEAFYIKNKLFRTLPPRKTTGCLNENDIRELTYNGFTIGNHTTNHINLEATCDSNQIKTEIAEDKSRLEKITGTNIQYFSYPTGAHNNPDHDLTKLLYDLGYKGAVTTTPGFNNFRTNPFLLHRDITDAAMRNNIFKARSFGNYDAVTHVKQNINKFKKFCSHH